MGRALSLVSSLAVLACGPGKPGFTGSEPGSTASDTGAPTTSTAGDAAASTSGAGDTTGVQGPGSSSSSSSSGSFDESFIPDPPDQGVAEACNQFVQDCPAGEKCMPYADDGGTSWNNLKCVPVDPDPKQLHEACTAPQGGVAGLDDCDVGLMCWDVDAEGHGTCFELCKGSPEAGTCEDPNTTCALYSEAILTLCLPMCDPLKQDCDPGDVCIGNPAGEGFLCVLDASGEEGQLHDPCEFANACDPGLLCNSPDAAVECDPNAMGCCEPFCNFAEMEACPGVGQVCLPYFEEGQALPGHEDVGYCAVPL